MKDKLKKSLPKWIEDRFHIEKWHIIAFLMMIYDLLAIAVAYFLALWLRADAVYGNIWPRHLMAYQRFILPYALASVVCFWCFKMYKAVWRYASFDVLVRTITCSFISSLLHALLITVLFIRMPISYYLWGAVIQMILIVSVRFMYRLMQYEHTRRHHFTDNAGRVMLIGAGAAGQMIK